jgi:hypothetical protein
MSLVEVYIIYKVLHIIKTVLGTSPEDSIGLLFAICEKLISSKVYSLKVNDIILIWIECYIFINSFHGVTYLPNESSECQYTKV